MSLSVTLCSAVIVAVSVLVYWTAPRVEITPNMVSIDEGAAQNFSGVKHTSWDGASLLFQGMIIGPESITHDPVSGDIFTGTQDGYVWKIRKDLSHAEVVLRMGEEHPECGSPAYGPICGRVLGLSFVAGDKLVVADAYLGIFAVHVNTKTKQALVRPDRDMHSRSLKIFNSVDVSKEGVVYFTVSSMRWPLHDLVYSVLEADNTGRVYSYDLVTQELALIASNISFANGLAVSHEGDALIVAECMKRRVLKIELRRPHTVRVLVDNLPGGTDNIRRASQGSYLVAIPSTGSLTLLAFMYRHPSVAAWSAWLIPKWVLFELINVESKVVQFDGQGRIIQVFHGRKDNLQFVTEAYEAGDNLIFGSLRRSFLAVLKKNEAGPD